MSLTLENLINIPPFNEGYLLTGSHCIYEDISALTVMDIPNIDEWIKSNELIIAGNFFNGTIDKELISRLKQKKCSGIITKEKFLSYISEDLIKHADKIGFPIFIVPDKYSWSELMHPVNNTIIETLNKQLLDYDKYQNVLIHSLLKNPTFENICNDISSVLTHPIAIIRNDTIVDSSDDFNWGNSLNLYKSLRKEAFIVGRDIDGKLIYGSSINIDTEENKQLIIYPIKNETDFLDYLFIIIKKSNTRRLSQSLSLKIQTFIHILGLKCTLYLDIYKKNVKYQELILDELLNSPILSSTDKIKYEIALGRILESTYYVAIIDVLDKERLNNYYLDTYSVRFSEYLSRNYLQSDKVIVFDHQSKFVLFLGGSVKDIKSTVKSIFEYFHRFFNTNNIYMGVSQLRNLGDCALAVKEAKEALNTAIKMSIKEHFMFYTSLGFLRLLTNKDGNIDNIYFEELLNSFVYPIVDYDTKYNTELLKTIKLYINNNFSVQKTSDTLFIHKNTLRSRLKRIETILSIDLDNSDNLLNLQIALKIYFTLKEIQ